MAGALTAQAQQKMPLPVEDDPNAPQELRSQKAEEPAPATHSAPPPESPSSPVSQAQVNYHDGEYEKAYDAIQGIDPTAQDDAFVVLYARILTELKRYDDGEKLLRQRIDQEAHSSHAQSAAQSQELIVTLGDLLLHKRSYDRAAKYYTVALQSQPNDPDLKLKLIYARIGTNDLRGADQLATQLSPFDPKNPYDDHAAFYFARAALARALGRTQEAEDDIQNARTNYGITVTNRYLKTYLQFFSSEGKGAPSGIEPTPAYRPVK